MIRKHALGLGLFAAWCVVFVAIVAAAHAQTQTIHSECNTWGNGHQRVQGTWDLSAVFIPGGFDASGKPLPDREEWGDAVSKCFHDDELVDGQIPEADRPHNGMVIPCIAQQKWIEQPKGAGIWVQKWFYPSQDAFCQHNPYQGWMLCGSFCKYPLEYYQDATGEPPTSTTMTTTTMTTSSTASPINMNGVNGMNTNPAVP